MAGEGVDYQSAHNFLTHELGFTSQVAGIGLDNDPDYLTQKKMQLFSSVPGLPDLIRHAREVETLWLPDIGGTSGALRVAMNKTPVCIAGGILRGDIQSMDDIRTALVNSRKVLNGIINDPQYFDRDWDQKTIALLQELDEVLQTI